MGSTREGFRAVLCCNRLGTCDPWVGGSYPGNLHRRRDTAELILYSVTERSRGRLPV